MSGETIINAATHAQWWFDEEKTSAAHGVVQQLKWTPMGKLMMDLHPLWLTASSLYP